MDNDLGTTLPRGVLPVSGMTATARYTADDGSVIYYKRCAECEHWFQREANFIYYAGIKKWSSYCYGCKVWRDRKYRNYKEEADALRDQLFEKFGRVCQICGEGREAILDFYHQEYEQQKIQRRKKWNKRRRYQHAIKHLDKYILLCKNCHYLEHHPNNAPTS